MHHPFQARCCRFFCYCSYLSFGNGWQQFLHHLFGPFHAFTLLSLPLGLLPLLVAFHTVDALRCLCKDQIVNLGVALCASEAICMICLVTCRYTIMSKENKCSNRWVSCWPYKQTSRRKLDVNTGIIIIQPKKKKKRVG